MDANIHDPEFGPPVDESGFRFRRARVGHQAGAIDGDPGDDGRDERGEDGCLAGEDADGDSGQGHVPHAVTDE